MRALCIFLGLSTLSLTSCGSGGGGSTTSPVTVTTDEVTLNGQAGWPGATTLAVTVDDVSVPLTGADWICTLDMRGAMERTVRVAVIADGITVAMRDVTVRR